MRRRPSVSQTALAVILDSIQSVSHGTVTLIIQNGRLLQIEKTDKIRLDYLERTNSSAKNFINNQEKLNGIFLDERQIKQLHCRLVREIQDLTFGQIILIIKDRILVQIERITKQRLIGLEGIYGDGI